MAKERDAVGVQFGRNLRRLRAAAGLSQTELGGRLGVSCQQVQKYEAGQDRVSVATLHRLTRALASDYAAFFAGLGHDAAGFDPPDAESEYATRRWSRAVQSIGDGRVRKCLIDLGRELAMRS